MTRAFLILRAWLLLADHDLFMRRHDLSQLLARVSSFKVRKARRTISSSELSDAFDVACIFYVRQALCLQRSAVLVRLLRSHGLPAEMVIGVQKLPFKAHAWVRLDGSVISDRRVLREDFLVMEVV